MINTPIILASTSASRKRMLTYAGVPFETRPAGIDEDSITASLIAEGARPVDVADALAEMKARKIAERFPDAVVIGSDQVLSFENTLWQKPKSKDHCKEQLSTLRSKSHHLFSAVVVYHGAKPVWRSAAEAKLTMRDFSDTWLEGYLDRNWDKVKSCIGGYMVEEEGIRLFSAIEGDHFTILGLPLLPLLRYLELRGWIEK